MSSENQLSWQLRTRTITLGTTPLVMGIVNATPDSFSDGGLHEDANSAIDVALRMEDAGAAIIDIGGESTRPYSEGVAIDEERRRVLPVIAKLSERLDCPISIDTSKAIVAREAVEAGAEIINDVTGLDGDPEMLEAARATEAGVCVMHMQGTPQTMQDDPNYDDVVEDIYSYLNVRKADCIEAGIPRERICLDPGIGFGKTHEHNFDLLRRAARFKELGQPVLIGHSRKGFIKKLVGDDLVQRDAGTLGVSMAMASQGIHILRVHNVPITVAALRLYAACGC